VCDGCASHLSYNDQGIANRLYMSLADIHDALQAAIAADNHTKQVEQAKKEEELKKAGANKPPAL
jgi:hypothetical protein